jgi:integrase
MHDEISNFLASFPYAETTKKSYWDILPRILTKSPDLANMAAAELLEILANTGWQNARQCVGLAATKQFLKWKYGDKHPALAAKLKRSKGKPQRALDKETAIRLLASFDTYTAKGARDLAICSLALDTGLRVSELCRIQEAHTDLELCALEVIVKGGEWEAAIFSEQTAGYIERWLGYRGPVDSGYLFTNLFTGDGLTAEGLNIIVRTWGWSIGIQLSPHDLRRSMAVMATLNGASERSLMEMGRWKSSDMIKRYTRTLRLQEVRKYLAIRNLLAVNDPPTKALKKTNK